MFSKFATYVGHSQVILYRLKIYENLFVLSTASMVTTFRHGMGNSGHPMGNSGHLIFCIFISFIPKANPLIYDTYKLFFIIQAKFNIKTI